MNNAQKIHKKLLDYYGNEVTAVQDIEVKVLFQTISAQDADTEYNNNPGDQAEQ